MFDDNTHPRGHDERLNDICDRFTSGMRLLHEPGFEQVGAMVISKAVERYQWWTTDQIDAEFHRMMEATWLRPVSDSKR